MALERPLLVGHSFGGVIALADAGAHPDRAGVVDIDGFDFRERALFDEVDATEVDRFVEDFRHVAPPDNGGDEWLEEQREVMRQISSTWKVPDDVAAATFERIFVRDGEGWRRRPSNAFFDFVNTDEGRTDTLQLLRAAKVPAVFVLCRPPGDAGMFEKGRAGLERHIRTIASEDGEVRLETIDATHGVIFEEPTRIAEIVRSML
jgi:pimeloyl-ACP methyl ester carboxylesterase